MKIKYLQGVADIYHHYKDILRYAQGNGKYDHLLLETWNIELKDMELIREEYEFLRYLLGVQLGIIHEESAIKPSIEIVNRCLNRHLSFIKEIYRYDDNTKEKANPIVVREYKACKHYLFQFSLNGWYKRLPDKILSYEEKYRGK